MICPKCGRNVQDNTRFCTGCGASLEVQQPGQTGQPPQSLQVQQKKSPIVPILVALCAVLLIGVGVMVAFLLKDNDSSNTVTDGIVADGGSNGSDVQPVATTEPTEEPTPEPTLEPTATPEPTPEPTATPYVAELGIENSMRVNGTTSYSGIERLKYYKLFNKKGKPVDVPVRVKLKSKRRSVGDRYKLTCSVVYRFTSNPKVNKSEMARIKGYGKKKTEHILRSNQYYTVFDYRTGKCLEGKNDHRVKSKCSRWKYKFYNKQRYDTSSHWYTWKNRKSLSFSFTVTYPKSYEDLCVGVGFYNKFDDESSKTDYKYWNGKCAFGKTEVYRKSKDSAVFLLPE